MDTLRGSRRQCYRNCRAEKVQGAVGTAAASYMAQALNDGHIAVTQNQFLPYCDSSGEKGSFPSGSGQSSPEIPKPAVRNGRNTAVISRQIND